MGESKEIDITGPLQEKSVPKLDPELMKGASLLALLGPGIVSAACDIGSGEIVYCSVIGASYGFALVWALVAAAFFKWWPGMEAARYTLCTGESAMHGFYRLSKWLTGIIAIICLIMILSGPGGVIGAAGTAAAALTGWGTFGTWAAILTILGALVICLGKRVYSIMEKITLITGAIMIGGMFLVGAWVTTPETLIEFFKGAISFGYIPPGLHWGIMLSFLGFGFGSGGEAAIRYTNLIKEKGWSMGKYTKGIAGLFSKEESPGENMVGFKPSTTPEDIENYNRWFKVFLTDAAGVMWPMNFFGAAIFLYLGAVILHPKGLVPAGIKIAVTQAEYFKVAMGDFGWYLFLFLIVINLWDTWISAFDVWARPTIDFFTMALRKYIKAVDARKWYFILLAYCTIGTIWLGLGGVLPGVLLLILGWGTVALYPIVSVGMFIINRRYLPKEYQGKALATILNLLSAVFFSFFWIFNLLWTLKLI